MKSFVLKPDIKQLQHIFFETKDIYTTIKQYIGINNYCLELIQSQPNNQALQTHLAILSNELREKEELTLKSNIIRVKAILMISIGTLIISIINLNLTPLTVMHNQ